MLAQLAQVAQVAHLAMLAQLAQLAQLAHFAMLTRLIALRLCSSLGACSWYASHYMLPRCTLMMTCCCRRVARTLTLLL